ncbi:hypothetical protein [Poritiphilus flavus]|uniref:Uncharacterized protein n=1 Tax=Poritiphilus flavus TaxID=2697053 RepID=A0A6L9E9A2_9FLAO|nr:hypothetical protein [Poritiphilus flavus]NAS11337.1 hypothetical protein [Poritiphilus flavus]
MSGIFSYFKFYLGATNQHGIHSPFVYRLLTEGLYAKHSFKKLSKSQKVLLKCIDYFKAVKLHFPAGEHKLISLVTEYFPNSDLNTQPFDLVYLDISETEELRTYISEPGLLTNDSVLFIDNIHQTRLSLDLWHQHCSLPEITVSIDLFYCGLMFVRREQVKQHFRIRI